MRVCTSISRFTGTTKNIFRLRIYKVSTNEGSEWIFIERSLWRFLFFYWHFFVADGLGFFFILLRLKAPWREIVNLPVGERGLKAFECFCVARWQTLILWGTKWPLSHMIYQTLHTRCLVDFVCASKSMLIYQRRQKRGGCTTSSFLSKTFLLSNTSQNSCLWEF